MGFFRFMARNWKTTLGGVVAIVGTIPTVAPFIPIVNQVIESIPQTKQEWLAAAILAAGAGLLAAKDSNVTGGTKRNADW